jgi:amidase
MRESKAFGLVLLTIAVMSCTAPRSDAQRSAAASAARAQAMMQAHEPYLNAFIQDVPHAEITAEARAVDAKENLPLQGLAFAVKDNIAVANMPLTFGSKAFQHVRPSRDAPAVARLRASGAVFVGKTNLDEFAGDIWGVSGLGGQTRNLFSKDHGPGGSSAGSAVAVGAGMADIALGTDTCASILLPAAYAGIVGMRPSHGLVPLTGVLPGFLDQDVIGPMAKDVRTLRLAIHSLTNEALPKARGDMPGKPLRVGVAALNMRHNPDVQAMQAFAATIARLQNHSIEAVEIDIDIKGLISRIDKNPLHGQAMHDVVHFLRAFPHSPVKDAGDFLLPDIASFMLGPPKGPRSYYQEHARSKIESNAAKIMRAADMQELRTKLDQAMAAAGVSVLILPTTEAFPLKLTDTEVPEADFEYCQWSAYSGLPAIALPAGQWPKSKFPYSLMLLGRAQDDATLLEIAEQLEKHVSPFGN